MDQVALPSVKLIALDLDGTIFTDDLIISRRMREAISAAQAQGIIVTIATGRMFWSARQIAADLNIKEPLISYQGAMVSHSVTGEMLYHKTVPLHLAHEIVAEAASRGLHLNLYSQDRAYITESTPEAEFYAKINMGLQLHVVSDFHTFLDEQGGTEPTKLVIVTAPSQTDSILELFTRLYGDRLQVIKSHARFTEFTNVECSKGRALEFLANYCEIPREEVMAIGDGHNDLDMISWAGYGVAMPTSPQPVLSAARFVASTLAEDGAAQMIERYALRTSR